jgi:hypothetical protein
VADITGGVLSNEQTIAAKPGLDALTVSADVLAYGTMKHHVAGLQRAGTRPCCLARKPNVVHAYVYDTATGTTEKVGPALFERKDIGGNFVYFATAALGGHFVTYQQKDGSSGLRSSTPPP